MRSILVSLISDQTIPNVQFIKEKLVDEYLFISTEAMEKKGVLNWVLKATNLEYKKIQVIIVSPFSYDDVYEVLEKSIQKDTKYLVNLTGGTKIMSLAVNDVFKSLNAEMYYLIGNKSYLKISPGIKTPIIKLEKKISLSEYFIAYGFEIMKQSDAEFSFETSEKIFHYFINSFDKTKDISSLSFLYSKRGKKVESVDQVDDLTEFLVRIRFETEKSNQLSKKETKYLTGDWFEEYFYHQLKQYKTIQNDGIGTGWTIVKNGIPNEFDILFITEDQLNIIECKTFIWKDSEETQTIIAETIYKADSLKNKLGLFAKTSILTLSDLSSPSLKEHLQRAKENNISIYGKEGMYKIEETIKKLL